MQLEQMTDYAIFSGQSQSPDGAFRRALLFRYVATAGQKMSCRRFDIY